jgi:hypothetical protein
MVVRAAKRSGSVSRKNLSATQRIALHIRGRSHLRLKDGIFTAKKTLHRYWSPVIIPVARTAFFACARSSARFPIALKLTHQEFTFIAIELGELVQGAEQGMKMAAWPVS